MAAVLISSREHHLTYCSCVINRRARHKRKISIAAINSLPGKNCLVAAIGRSGIAGHTHTQGQNRKARAETETWHRSPRQYFAAKRSRPTIIAHRVVRKTFPVKSFFTLRGHCGASRLFSPASPTASPESEFLGHGCVASRGVCKGAPLKF